MPAAPRDSTVQRHRRADTADYTPPRSNDTARNSAPQTPPDPGQSRWRLHLICLAVAVGRNHAKLQPPIDGCAAMRNVTTDLIREARPKDRRLVRFVLSCWFPRLRHVEQFTMDPGKRN